MSAYRGLTYIGILHDCYVWAQRSIKRLALHKCEIKTIHSINIQAMYVQWKCFLAVSLYAVGPILVEY